MSVLRNRVLQGKARPVKTNKKAWAPLLEKDMTNMSRLNKNGSLAWPTRTRSPMRSDSTLATSAKSSLGSRAGTRRSGLRAPRSGRKHSSRRKAPKSDAPSGSDPRIQRPHSFQLGRQACQWRPKSISPVPLRPWLPRENNNGPRVRGSNSRPTESRFWPCSCHRTRACRDSLLCKSRQPAFGSIGTCLT